MNTLSQGDRDALNVAVEAILLDLPHRWQPSNRQTIARLRKRDDQGRPTVEASAWLLKTASAIVSDLKPDTLVAFPSDPVDHACLVAAMFLLSLSTGLPADNLAAHKVASTLRELEANARRHEHATKAASAGRSRATDMEHEAPVRAAIDAAIRATPGVSTATLMKTLRPKLKAMGVELGDAALRKRIERRRQ